jgi:dipeptide transport system permease protein
LHPLGTDEFGRDMLSRIIYGARLTIGLAAAVVTIAMLAGFAIGAISAAVGGILDIVVMRIMDVLLAVPSLLLAVILVMTLGGGLLNSVYAVTLALLPHFVRSTRRSMREELAREYVAAARLDGASGLTLLLRSLLPNMATPLIVQTTLALSTALLDITAIGFLGLGAQAPLPEWGALLYSAHDLIQIAPWTVVVPGAAIFLAVLSTNLVGDALRNALDPRGQHH